MARILEAQASQNAKLLYTNWSTKDWWLLIQKQDHSSIRQVPYSRTYDRSEGNTFSHKILDILTLT